MKYLIVLTAVSCLRAGDAELAMDLRDWPVRIGTQPQLFVDSYLVARHSGIAWQVHQPEKLAANPILVPSPPLETVVLAYGSVLRAESGGFRLWYTNNIGISYAESRDGVSWTRPPAGLVIDDRQTNVLTRGHRGRSDTLTVFLNPDTKDLRRKFLAYAQEYRFPDKDGIRETRREGIYLRTSADGVHWDERPDPVMYSVWRNREDQQAGDTAELGDVHHISWDPVLRKFMGHIKLERNRLRMRGLVESDDGTHWSQPELILQADEKDRPGDQIYSMIAFPYESAWLAFIGLFHAGTDDRMDIQLASSRDGRHWHRPWRATFLPNGPEGSFDWGVMHMMANPPLRVADKLYIYYDGSSTRHSVKLRDVRKMGIGLATLRPQGFVSVDATAEGGMLITRPLTFSGDDLRLNAAIRRGGEIRVSALGADYKPIDGYESIPVAGDDLNLSVRWKSHSNLAAARAKGDVRLQFKVKDASLYSFSIR
jgi:hypothetical protein